jgi:hypothetical protein
MKQFFTEDNGRLSMKRLCGLMCVVALCITMYHNSFSDLSKAPSEALVYAVASLAFGCLGLTTAEKIFKKKDNGQQESN